MTHSDRSAHIDLCRNLALGLVVLGHSRWIQIEYPDFYRFIYLFHMPTFFFLSGYVYKAKDFGSFLGSRVDRLLVPFFVVSLLGLVLLFLKSDAVGWGNVLGVLWAAGYTLPWIPLWFLPTLFVVSIVGWVLIARLKGLRSFLVAVIGLLVIQCLVLAYVPDIYNQDGRPIGWPWGLDIAAFCLAFYVMGNGFCKGAGRFGLGGIRGACMGLACLAILLLAQVLGASLDINYRRFSPFVLVVPAALAGTLALLCLSAVVVKRWPAVVPCSAWFSERGMVIYLLHAPILSTCSKVLQNVSLGEIGAIVVSVVAPVLAYDLVIKKVAWLNFSFGGGRRVTGSA